MKENRVVLLPAGLLCAVLGSCSLLSCSLFSALGPDSEAPVDEKESYLTTGPQTQVDLGGGEEQLLTRFQKVLDEKIHLQDRQKELLTEIDALRTALLNAQTENEKERLLRAGAEAEGDRLRRAKGDRETKILHLHMQVAELERVKMQLEIAAVERQLEILEQENAASPPGGGHE